MISSVNSYSALESRYKNKWVENTIFRGVLPTLAICSIRNIFYSVLTNGVVEISNLDTITHLSVATGCLVLTGARELILYRNGWGNIIL